MFAPDPFANADYYRTNGFPEKPGTTDEDLDQMLKRASRSIRSEVPRVDARIVSGVLDPDLVSDIACEMVATLIGTDHGPGVESVQQTAGPYAHTMKFANPRGDLYLTAKHKRQLAETRKRRAFTVRVGNV